MSVPRSLVAAAIVALSVVALALTAPTILPDDGPSDSPASATGGGPADRPGSSPSGSPSGAPSGSPGASTTPGPDASSAPGPQSSGPSSKPAKTVAETDPSVSATPTGLPGLSPPNRAPLLTRPLPEAAQAQGTLAEGYPGTVLPAAPRSRITASSVSPSGDRLQVTLTATRPGGTDAVLRFYRISLTGHGLTEVPVQAVGGSQAAAFRRGRSSVVVTVTPGSTTTYSVFATLAVAGA